MKKGLFLSLLVGTAVIYSCQKEDLGGLKSAQLNTLFTSQVNEKVYLTSENASLTLEVESIVDHRCKAHSSCSDPGVCSVRVKVSNLDKSTAETILIIDNSSEQETNNAQVKLDKKSYLVHLEGVSPKPSSTTETSLPKEAEFLVSEAQ